MKAACGAPGDTFSDEELAALVQGGDISAFTLLSDRYMPLLQSRAGRYSSLVGIDTEDFVQEGMLALYRAAKGYNPINQAQFGTYAITCINNSMSDAIRAHMKNNREGAHIRIDDIDEQKLGGGYSAGTGSNPVEDTYLNQEQNSLRAQQIETLLSDFEQQVLKLYLRGHTYQQISLILSTATKAVDNALQRVRRKLRLEI